MQVVISSDIKIYDATPVIYEYCQNNLIMRNPLYTQLIVMGKEDTIRRKHVPEFIHLWADVRGCVILPFGCLRSIWPLISKASQQIKFNDSGDMSIKDQKMNIEGLYDYQEEAVEHMVKARGGVLVSPAGSGKTYMGIEIAKRIGKKTLWLCHTGDLLRQAKDDILTLYQLNPAF